MLMRVPNTVHSEGELRNTLDLLYAKSKEGKSFTGILELATNEQVIVTAIHNIKSNRGSLTSGIDRKTINTYLQMPKKTLINHIRQSFKSYNPKPVKRCYIDKSDGRKRPLGIPTILDRIIQECLRIVLEPIVEAKFYGHSYGFRPYRSTSHAMARIVSIINKQRYWCIEGDIKGFFDNVNHRLLINKMRRIGILDKRVLAIIKKILKAGFLENNEIQPTSMGTPQGGILSPLLANIYLNDFDWTIARMYDRPKSADNRASPAYARKVLIEKHGIKPVFLTRYADDWIIQTTDEKEAQRLQLWLEKYFKHKLKLQLSPTKTLTTDCRIKPVTFLGFHIVGELRRSLPDKPRTMVGKAYPDPCRVKTQIRNLINCIKKLSTVRKESTLAVEIERINAKIVGIAEYWKTSIAGKVLGRIDFLIEPAIYKVFRKRYGTRTFANKIPITKLDNRPNRHKFDRMGKPLRRKQKTWGIRLGEMNIGFTLATLTPIEYSKKFNPILTPYTKEGREAYCKVCKRLPLARPPIYDTATLIHSTGRRLYNFEYMMNREYAFNLTYNRKKGQHCCPVCGTELINGNRHCHHKDGSLSLDEVNKVKNLVWLCLADHTYVEYGISEEIELDKTRRSKIEKLIKTKKLHTDAE
jgi:group II intron reverse transcriptase/maturase